MTTRVDCREHVSLTERLEPSISTLCKTMPSCRDAKPNTMNALTLPCNKNIPSVNILNARDENKERKKTSSYALSLTHEPTESRRQLMCMHATQVETEDKKSDGAENMPHVPVSLNAKMLPDY